MQCRYDLGENDKKMCLHIFTTYQIIFQMLFIPGWLNMKIWNPWK